MELPDDRDAHKFCTTIEGVFSSKECNKIVERSEEAGFKTALVNVGRGEVHDPDYRNSDRCIIDDCDIAKAIFERIKDFLPKILNGGSGSSWELVGVNERMRILRYSDGHFFAKHKDGSHTCSVHRKNKHGSTTLRFCNISFMARFISRQNAIAACLVP